MLRTALRNKEAALTRAGSITLKQRLRLSGTSHSRASFGPDSAATGRPSAATGGPAHSLDSTNPHWLQRPLVPRRPDRLYGDLRGERRSPPGQRTAIDITQAASRAAPASATPTGAYLITPHSAYGSGGRAPYGPTFSRPDGPWVWEGDVP